MTPSNAKKVMGHAKSIANHAAEICASENELNNQTTLSSLMLATCIMARFFNEDKALMHNLLDVLLAATEEIPPDEQFMQ